MKAHRNQIPMKLFFSANLATVILTASLLAFSWDANAEELRGVWIASVLNMD